MIGTNYVGHEFAVRCWARPHHHYHFFNTRMLAELVLDLSDFDTEATYLYLAIYSSEER